jgi:hypothetical protein
MYVGICASIVQAYPEDSVQAAEVCMRHRMMGHRGKAMQTPKGPCKNGKRTNLEHV